MTGTLCYTHTPQHVTRILTERRKGTYTLLTGLVLSLSRVWGYNIPGAPTQRDSRIETFCCRTPQREKPLISQPARHQRQHGLSRHMKEGVQPKINRIQSPRGNESQCWRSVSTQLYQLPSIVTSFSLTLLLCRVHSQSLQGKNNNPRNGKGHAFIAKGRHLAFLGEGRRPRFGLRERRAALTGHGIRRREGRPACVIDLERGEASHTHKGYSLHTTTPCQQPTSTLSIINLQEIGPARCTPAEERMEDTASIISLSFARCRSLECVLNDRSAQRECIQWNPVAQSISSTVHLTKLLSYMITSIHLYYN